MIVNSKGFWENKNNIQGHYDDYILAPHLIQFFKNEKAENIVDLGCGNGFYVKEMIKSGLKADGFDGNPNTPAITDNVCGVFDLSIAKKLEIEYDWVLSLEVGEHLPKKYEQAFLENLHLNNKKGIILSWAIVGQGGTGHFNEQNNDYVKQKLNEMGYFNDLDSETFLRSNCGLRWFKNTIMVFRTKATA